MDYVFIKEGYALWAATFGPFWSLANGMWVEFALHTVLLIAMSTIMDIIGFNAGAISGALYLSNIIFGLFARDLQRFHMERSGYSMVSTVIGKSFAECEARYFRKREKERFLTTNSQVNTLQQDPEAQT